MLAKEIYDVSLVTNKRENKTKEAHISWPSKALRGRLIYKENCKGQILERWQQQQQNSEMNKQTSSVISQVKEVYKRWNLKTVALLTEHGASVSTSADSTWRKWMWHVAVERNNVVAYICKCWKRPRNLIHSQWPKTHKRKKGKAFNRTVEVILLLLVRVKRMTNDEDIKFNLSNNQVIRGR